MRPPPRRPRGRAVPPTPVASEDDPFDDFGIVALRFAPPLTLADFRRVAEAHGLAYVPTEDEPQIFRPPQIPIGRSTPSHARRSLR